MGIKGIKETKGLEFVWGR